MLDNIKYKINNLKELRSRLKELQKKYGQKYFIFIAPFELKECKKINIFDHYVYNKIQSPDFILKNQNNLDIYFVEYSNISSMRSSKPVFFCG
jgi:hypothetical protein